jgi:putative ABC transport system permease protein
MDHPQWENKTAMEIAEQVRYVIVHHEPGAAAEAKARLQAHWREFFPDQAFSFVVLEDFLAGLSSSNHQQLSLVGIFGSLCILIASLGLYSLTAFAAEQRSKEIAVRKVMGATATQIVVLFTRGLMKLVILAGLLASVVSWWVVSEWLQGFHYQQSVSVLVFFIATVLMSLIAVLTIGLQSSTIANRNPGLMLRYE